MKLITILAIAVMANSAYAADGASERFLRAMNSRKLASSRCFAWCKNGKSSGGWWGWAVYCRCNEGWEGACCDKMTTCEAGRNTVCPWNRMQVKSGRCKDVSSNGPIRVAKNVPKNLQGIFWLQNQKDSSAICSFAKSNDGGKLSTGYLVGKGGKKEDNYSIRVGGDKVWSFHSKGTSWKLVELLDLVYNFRFDNVENPTDAQIIPEARNFNLILEATWLLDFDMKVLTEDEKVAKYKKDAEGRETVVWGRPSTVLGIEIDSAYYELVQIIRADGSKTPAFDEWVEYCEDDVTGSTPGEFYYREAQN